MVINNAKYYRPADSKCLLVNKLITGSEPEYYGSRSFYENCEGINITKEVSDYVSKNGNITMSPEHNYGRYNISGIDEFVSGRLEIPDPCPGIVKQLDINYNCV